MNEKFTNFDGSIAEAVIIGGGVIGASVAFHLAKRGIRDIVVLDRGSAPGQGNTGKATGGFRCQFGSEINVKLSMLSRGKLLEFEQETGINPGYRSCGYLLVSSGLSDQRELENCIEVQSKAGFNKAESITRQKVNELNPAIYPECVFGGSWCPTDGFIRPLDILKGYKLAAEKLGVSFQYGSACTGFDFKNGKINSVKTDRGMIRTGCVVNAAGAWAGNVAALAGIDIPVSPLRRQVSCSSPTNLLPEDMPLTVFTEDGFHLRVRNSRVLLLWPDDPETTDPFDTRVERNWLNQVVDKAISRIPLLKDLTFNLKDCWAGLYAMTPDKHVILGPSAEIDNFYLVCGASGHGVMHSPALGQLTAELIHNGNTSSLDIHCLRATRFEEQDPISGSVLL